MTALDGEPLVRRGLVRAHGTVGGGECHIAFGHASDNRVASVCERSARTAGRRCASSVTARRRARCTAPARRRRTTTSSATDRVPTCWRTRRRTSIRSSKRCRCGSSAACTASCSTAGRPTSRRATRPSAGTSIPTIPATSPSASSPTVAEHRDELSSHSTRGVQTNEVGRCAALLARLPRGRGARPGCRCACSRSAPARVSTCAGIATATRAARAARRGATPRRPFGSRASTSSRCRTSTSTRVVAERAGCDRSPIDATTADGALTLRSFVWPDQLDRFAALDAALAVGARRFRCPLERADAGDWVEAQLARPPARRGDGRVHSIVWQYLSTGDARRVCSTRSNAPARSATDDAPVAWLRMEPGQDPTKSAEVRLTRWPDGRERVVARTGYHGRPVRSVSDARRRRVPMDAARPTSP